MVLNGFHGFLTLLCNLCPLQLPLPERKTDKQAIVAGQAGIIIPGLGSAERRRVHQDHGRMVPVEDVFGHQGYVGCPPGGLCDPVSYPDVKQSIGSVKPGVGVIHGHAAHMPPRKRSFKTFVPTFVHTGEEYLSRHPRDAITRIILVEIGEVAKIEMVIGIVGPD